jgi:hypothetical protein
MATSALSQDISGQRGQLESSTGVDRAGIFQSLGAEQRPWHFCTYPKFDGRVALIGPMILSYQC